MLVLVDAPVFRLSDRPNLGCAMLIASCTEHGIDTTLVSGQTRFLADLLLHGDVRYSLQLLEDLPRTDLARLRLGKQGKQLRQHGIQAVCDELQAQYRDIVVSKNLRSYLDPSRIGTLMEWVDALGKLHWHALARGHGSDLPVIRRYLSAILEQAPRYIGFSQESFDPLSREIRRRLRHETDARLIVGGPFTPFLPPDRLAAAFAEECCDFLVTGPGELALPRLLAELHEGRPPRTVANVCYPEQGRVRSNQPEPVRDLDRLPPPDYRQFDLDAYVCPTLILPLQSARGCSWQRCAFCGYRRNALGTHITWSAERVVETLEHLHTTHHCTHFQLHDDDLPPARAEELSTALLASDLPRLSLSSYARFDRGFDDAGLLALIRRAGFVAIHWGLESGSQQILDRMHKGTRVPVMRSILRRSAQQGIANLCMAFIGFPGESQQDVEQTVRLCQEESQSIHNLDLAPFHLAEGSRLKEDPARWGVVILDDGSYTADTGMSTTEARQRYRELLADITLGTVQVTSDRLRCLREPGHCTSRVVGCLLGLELPAESVLQCLAGSRNDEVFPIVPGRVVRASEDGEAGDRLHPVRIASSSLLNRIRPQAPRALSRLEYDMVRLADGSLSLAEIITAVQAEHPAAEQQLLERGLDLFADLFRRRWAIALSSRWPVSCKKLN